MFITKSIVAFSIRSILLDDANITFTLEMLF